MPGKKETPYERHQRTNANASLDPMANTNPYQNTPEPAGQAITNASYGNPISEGHLMPGEDSNFIDKPGMNVNKVKPGL